MGEIPEFIEDTYLVWGSVNISMKKGKICVVVGGGEYKSDHEFIALIPKFPKRETKRQIKTNLHEVWGTREKEKWIFEDLGDQGLTKVDVIGKIRKVENIRIPKTREGILELARYIHRYAVYSVENLYKYLLENKEKSFHMIIIEPFLIKEELEIEWNLNPTASSNVKATPPGFMGISIQESEIQKIEIPFLLEAIEELERLKRKLQQPGEEVDENYTFDAFLKDLEREGTMIEERDPIVNDHWKLLQQKKQMIYYGVPGTGKTFLARKVAEKCDQVKFVQFHPSYGYEDFFGGIFPKLVNGKVNYEFRNGHFLNLVEMAKKNPDKSYCLIIDEINRANLPKVFGELLYSLEYRNEPLEITHGKKIAVPNNLYIIGTMNTSDRSLAEMDLAIRRRFLFVEVLPDDSLIQEHFDDLGMGNNPIVEKLIELFNRINSKIMEQVEPDARIGHSYFMLKDLEEKTIGDMIYYEIIPLLEDIFFQDREFINDILGMEIFRENGDKVSREGLVLNFLGE
ncbi:MAG: AAA family ATPase [Methanobacteriota archaeon]|nr:MAG: AAA family ATPase [Euryarchaeota archaeon]